MLLKIKQVRWITREMSVCVCWVYVFYYRLTIVVVGLLMMSASALHGTDQIADGCGVKYNFACHRPDGDVVCVAFVSCTLCRSLFLSFLFISKKETAPRILRSPTHKSNAPKHARMTKCTAAQLRLRNLCWEFSSSVKSYRWYVLSKPEQGEEASNSPWIREFCLSIFVFRIYKWVACVCFRFGCGCRSAKSLDTMTMLMIDSIAIASSRSQEKNKKQPDCITQFGQCDSGVNVKCLVSCTDCTGVETFYFYLFFRQFIWRNPFCWGDHSVRIGEKYSDDFIAVNECNWLEWMLVSCCRCRCRCVQPVN